MPVILRKPEPLSPEWWLERLHKQILKQREMYEFFNRYYTGDHPLPWLAPTAREEFRLLVRMTRSNYMGLVIDAMVERLAIEGFRFGADAEADTDTWRIWQANNMDAYSDMAFLEAGIGGISFYSAEPNPDDRSTPFIYVEHMNQCTIAYVPGTNRRKRKAALKVWEDEWTSETHATLQLRDEDNHTLWLFKYRAPKRAYQIEGETVDHAPRWERRDVPGEEWPANAGDLPVTIVENPNNPRLLSGGISELWDVTDAQDRINKTLFDRLQGQEFGVDPQKWAKGFPDEDKDGKPQVVTFGRNRMVTTDVAEAAFGNFAVAPLSPLSEAKREDVKDIASRTRTPAQYLLGEMVNVNGETLKASESGLISKVRERQRPFGEAAEEIIRIVRLMAGLGVPADARLETIWKDPQYRTEGELTDAVIKKVQQGIISIRQARVDLGYSPTTIEDLERDDETELGPVPVAVTGANENPPVSV